MNSWSQNKNLITMKQDGSTVRSIDEQVSMIDKITVPANAVTTFLEKSSYIRNILRQQVGLVKYEIFQQTEESGNLIVITIATWVNQLYLDNVKSVMQTEMKKAGLNMPKFLKQQGITMERGVYYSFVE